MLKFLVSDLMAELIVLRHGNTFDKGDVVRRVGARTDLELSSSGRAQAKEVGAHLAERIGVFSRIFAAPLKRTMQTAQIVRDATKSLCAIEPTGELTEIDYGPDEGKPEQEVVARIGDDALAAWESTALPPPGWRVDPSALSAAWRDMFGALKDAQGPVLAVTSNGVARFALAAAGNGQTGQFPQKLRTCAYGRVEIDANGAARIIEWDRRA